MSESRETLFVIDDEQLDAEAMRRILELQGYRVFTGSNYEDANRLMDEHGTEISLLVTDVSLPGRTGLEVASHLLKRKPTLKVLFVSGYVGAEVIRFYGVTTSDPHFLRKPFQADELVRRVREILSSSEPIRWIPLRNGDKEQETQDGS